jgi:LacI family transcriptional regulator
LKALPDKRVKVAKVPGRAVKIRDIADRSGISPATVSRVLNHPGIVSPELRERVQKAVAEMGYVPHGAARSLASSRTRTMGAVVPTVDSALFARVVDGLQQRIHDAGYQLLLSSSNYDPAREALEVRALLERGVDAMMLVGTSRDDDVYGLLAARGVPCVTTCSWTPAMTLPGVGWDNVTAAMRAARYLLDIGHRRFAIVAGVTVHNDRAQGRLDGFLRALEAGGIAIDRCPVIECPYTIPEARAAMASLLSRPQRPTAVLCGNDILAFGALQECLWAGVGVPGDISIVGFDDIDMAAHCHPSITTVRVPAYEVGAKAGELLMEAIRTGQPMLPVRIELELVVRATTAPPAADARPRVRRKEPTT